MMTEEVFLSLPLEEREMIISHGTAVRLSDLKKRHFLATSKMQYFEEKYNTTLPKLESEGLPDDASYEMHEDYIMWRHWAKVADNIVQNIGFLEEIMQQGLFMRN
jgi:hypothetical protein